MSSPLGTRGESIAADFFIRAGWSIVHRNFRAGRKEVDLVARRDGVVAFVEVKTRRGSRFGDPLDAITAHKRREVEEVAMAWIERHGAVGDVYRFDAVAVRLQPDGHPRIEHMEDAWYMIPRFSRRSRSRSNTDP